MACRLGMRDGCQVLSLKGTVTRADAPQIVALLRQAAPSLTRLGVDARGLRAVDTCILQVLCSAAKTARLFRIGEAAVLEDALDRAALARELLGATEGV